eukprot:symbB.v1.2.001387.t1/scaffold67.1/size356791/13
MALLREAGSQPQSLFSAEELEGLILKDKKDPVALQRCHHLVQQAKMERSDDANAPKIAVQDALWRAEAETKAICDLMTVAVDSLDVEVKDEEYVE